MTTPTIIVPGITGTNLVNSNTLDYDTIWSAVQSKFETLEDLELTDDAEFDVPARSIIRSSDVEDLAYGQLVDLVARRVGEPVYIFGYDWRRSNTRSGQALKEFVDYLRRKLKVSEFNFVTHSMGGHVFGCFLRELAGDYTCVRRAVLGAPPFLGSVKALIALVVGEGGVPLPLFNSNAAFRKIARTFPSLYELLPRYAGAVTGPGNTSVDLLVPSEWQSNVVAVPVVARRLGELAGYWAPNGGMLPLSDLPPAVRERIVVVAGTGEDTPAQVRVEQPPGEPRRFAFETPAADAGDGTVPLESALPYRHAVTTLAVKSLWYNKVTHPFFFNDGRVQNVVRRWLTAAGPLPAGWWKDAGDTVDKR